MHGERSKDLQLAIEEAIQEMWDCLNIEGRCRVKDEGRVLKGVDLKEISEPEAFTIEKLVRKVAGLLNLDLLPGRRFEWAGNVRIVDYRLRNSEGQEFLLEAKPINVDLYKKGEKEAVNQIKNVFQLVAVKEKYQFGIATDGLKWVFIDREGQVENEFDLRKDIEKIKVRLLGEERVVSSKTEEEITKKFYGWYDALLHGGTYKDHENNRRSISENDCLVKNIYRFNYEDDREAIAQTVVNRLIFIKFLQSKGIISEDILGHLTHLEERTLNATLNELFFRVFNEPISDRMNVSAAFKNIPYLNGSLFERTKSEIKNQDYSIKAEILFSVIEFLDSFSFVHAEGEMRGQIDPEILGYIFERAMTSSERKGTGAYYTPKTITKYISETTIHPFILAKANEILVQKGYKKKELLKHIETLLLLPATTLHEILGGVVNKITILDPACGSGAFLLAAGKELLSLQISIRETLNMRTTETGIKKLILQNNLYGVDLNSNSIEIAKLRLWLWLVTSYRSDSVEPLPNIEYNIMTGNSLIGHVDISKFKNKRLTLFDFDSAGEDNITLFKLMNQRELMLREYKGKKGTDARKMKIQLQKIEDDIGRMLDKDIYMGLQEKLKSEISYSAFKDLHPFHWGFEFYDIFNPDKPEGERGFDVVVGNPPYVRQETLGSTKAYLQQHYQVYHGVADLYAYFIEKGVTLLRSNGFFSYIVANKWMRANYGQPLRKWLKEQRLVEIIDFGDLPVFQDATTYPCILSIQKTDPSPFFNAAQVKTLQFHNLYSYIEPYRYKVLQTSLDEQGWSLVDEKTQALMDKLRNIGTPLGEYVNGEIFYGIKTGLNEAFVIDESTKDRLISEDPNCKELIKPFLTGKDVKRYQTPTIKKYLILLPKGWTNERMGDKHDAWIFIKSSYPSIANHLSSFAEKGEKRYDKGDYWWELRACDYYDAFIKPKMIFPDISKNNNFILDRNQHFFCGNTTYILSNSEIPLLAILNSKLMNFFYRNISSSYRGGYLRFIYQYMIQIPIKKLDFEHTIDKKFHQNIIGLVSQMECVKNEPNRVPASKINEQQIEEIDREIDRLVYELYGLTEEEIEIVEQATNV